MLSRVADSLFWISRYVERAESNARLMDVNLQITLDFDNTGGEGANTVWGPVLSTLEDRKVFDSIYPCITAEAVCDFVTYSEKNPNSIYSCIALARENARTVREYISSEMWERLNHLYLWLRSAAAMDLFQNSTIEFFRHIVDGSHQFQGTTDATLTHGEGWNFLEAGKFLERADTVSRILDLKYHILLPRGERVGGDIDTVQWIAVLKSCSGFEAYRKLHPGKVTPGSIAEFIILHDSFPRSIRYCADKLDDALHRISGCARDHFSNTAERLSGRLFSDLNYETIDNVFQVGLHEYLDNVQLRLVEIGAALHKQYCEWLEPEAAEAEGSSQSQSQA